MTKQRRIGIAALIPLATFGVACFGWGAGWNVYTNLALTLGDVVLWVTLARAVSPAASVPK